MGSGLMLPDWDIRLANYISSSYDTPFNWGTMDCITFANNAWREMTGGGFADDILGGYRNEKGAAMTYVRWLKSGDYRDIAEALDDRLTRLDTKFPPRGAIVAKPPNIDAPVIPYVFGVCIGRKNAFVGDQSLVFSDPNPQLFYWGV